MENPFDNYFSLLHELQGHHCFSSMSVSDQKIIEMEASNTLGFEANPEKFDSLYVLNNKIFLVYGITILESMVKDYTNYYMVNNVKNKDNESEIEELENPCWEQYLDENLINDNLWKKLIKEWVSNSLDSKSINIEFREKLINYFVSFRLYKKLYKAYIIRNLVVHNKSIMNDRNYNKAPFCQIGEEPKWDMSLLYDLFTSLNIYNTYLNNFNTGN